MKNLIPLLLLTGFFLKSYSQDFKNQVLTFTDEKRETVIIPEFLVLNKQTKKHEPYQVPFNEFYTQKNPLGIRYFNFGCIKTKKSGFWLGQIDKDSKGHAIFKDPIYGIRAMVILNAEIIEARNKNTLLKFFNVYAPSTDCIGSVKKVLVNGKYTCPDGYNDPEKYAKKVGDAIGLDINDEIELRDENGDINIKLMTLIINEVAQFETGKVCKFTEETVEKAMNLEVNEFVKQNIKNSSRQSIKRIAAGKQFSCGYTEVYFVEGFNADGELKDRFMVYKKDGSYLVSKDFIKWCAEQINFFNLNEFADLTDEKEKELALNNMEMTFQGISEFSIGFQSKIPENIENSQVGKYVTFVSSNDIVSYDFPTIKECNK